jgi:hypothetical protein
MGHLFEEGDRGLELRVSQAEAAALERQRRRGCGRAEGFGGERGGLARGRGCGCKSRMQQGYNLERLHRGPPRGRPGRLRTGLQIGRRCALAAC